MGFQFFPSCSMGAIIQLTKTDERYEYEGVRKAYNWWEKEAFFQYPAILISQHYMPQHDIRESLYIPEGMTVMGDSGGFQALTKGIDFDPLTVLRWQERTSNVAFTLDKPPVELAGSWSSYKPMTPEMFNAALEITVNNTKVMAENRVPRSQTPYNLELMNILHGATQKDMQTWFDGVAEYQDTLDGWAIAMKPPTPLNMSVMMAFLHSKGYTGKTHMLGTSGLNCMTFAVWLTKHFDDILLDSSTFARGMMSRDYTLPINVKDTIGLGDKANPDGIKLTTWPCICPVCSVMEPPNTIGKRIKGSNVGALISLHNLYWIEVTAKQLTSLVKDDDLYQDFISKYCKAGEKKYGVKLAIEFFEYYLQHGFDTAYRKFFVGGSTEIDQFFD